MSIIYMGYGWKLDLEPIELLVYLAIADHVDDDGEGCYASYKKLALKTNLDRSTVIRSVERLEKAGILVHQGTHPQYGTNVWNIDKAKLPFRKPARNGKTAKDLSPIPGKRRKAAPASGATPPGAAQADTPGGAVPPSGVAQSDQGGGAVQPGESHSATSAGGTAPPKSSHTLEEPLVESPSNHPGGRKPLPPAVDARVHPAAKTKTDRERAEKQAEAGEEDLQARDRPQTDLQRKVAQLCNAKYLTSAMKAGLHGTVSTAWRGNSTKLPVTYPSPEDEWAANPELFAEYVELCARRVREESGRPPARGVLIESIRRYARYNTGWLDYKQASQEEQRQAQKRASPSAKQNQYYYDPNKPDWMQ